MRIRLTPVFEWLHKSPSGCEGNAIQLVGGWNKFEGRVEVCQDGQWKTVCNRGWGDEEAQVVCRQLGFAEDSRSELLHKTSIQITVSDLINAPLKIITDLGWRIIRAQKLTFWSRWCIF